MTRGDVYMIDFGIPYGSEPGRHRPVVIVQSDKRFCSFNSSSYHCR